MSLPAIRPLAASAQLIALLDAAITLPAGCASLCLHASDLDDFAEQTMRLWASAHNLRVKADGRSVVILRDEFCHLASLMKPWREDTTLTEEQRAEMEWMEAGHA